jgi:hypothetical protein
VLLASQLGKVLALDATVCAVCKMNEAKMSALDGPVGGNVVAAPSMPATAQGADVAQTTAAESPEMSGHDSHEGAPAVSGALSSPPQHQQSNSQLLSKVLTAFGIRPGSTTKSGKSWSTKLRDVPSGKVRARGPLAPRAHSHDSHPTWRDSPGARFCTPPMQVREVLIASMATAGERAPSEKLGRGEAGSSISSAHADLTLDPSIQRLLEGLSLGATTTAKVVREASSFCEREGVMSIEALVEAEMEDEFVEALQLKKAPRKILRKRIAALPTTSGAASGLQHQMSGKI